jgi:hypothetical protein
MLLYGIIFTLPCLIMVIWPDRHARAVEKRVAEGDDRFFEEQRSYRAYPSTRNPRRIRIAGIIGTVCGLIFCASQLYRG